MSALGLVLALGMTAQAPRTVYADSERPSSGLAAFVGLESAGLLIQGASDQGRQAVSLSYLYASRGFELTQGRASTLLRSRYASLLVRDHSGATLMTRGGTGFELGGGWAALGRFGTAGGAFSAVIGPSVGIQGVLARGDGLTGRIPLGAELGLEGRIGPVGLFLLARPWMDLWFNRHPVYRAELGVGVGVF